MYMQTASAVEKFIDSSFAKSANTSEDLQTMRNVTILLRHHSFGDAADALVSLAEKIADKSAPLKALTYTYAAWIAKHSAPENAELKKRILSGLKNSVADMSADQKDEWKTCTTELLGSSDKYSRKILRASNKNVRDYVKSMIAAGKEVLKGTPRTGIAPHRGMETNINLISIRIHEGLKAV